MAKKVLKNVKSYLLKNNSKRIVTTSVIAIICIILFLLTYTIMVKSYVEKWSLKIYTGVTVCGIDIGGMTEEEAIETLNSELDDLFSSTGINVVVDGSTFTLAYDDINCQIDVEATVADALAYGKDESIFKQKSIIKKGETYSLNPEVTYDESAITDFVNEVNDSVKIEAQDAQLNVDNGTIVSVTEEVQGQEVNTEDLYNEIIDELTKDINGDTTIEVDMETYDADVTAEDLSSIDGVLSSYTTTFSNNSAGRKNNLQVATSRVNGTLLMPGEEFSYNDTIGETTEENGYMEANVYSGGQVVTGIGGGVCQVSSTLYNAIMRANISSTQRSNHSMTVSYVPKGLDATVARDSGIDYKFVNTYDYPIYIEGVITSNSITFYVYGNVESLNGLTYDMDSEVIETYDYDTEYVYDDTIDAGTETVTTSGVTGYKVQSYLIAYENGVEVSRELISTDTYKRVNEVITVGTKEVVSDSTTETTDDTTTEDSTTDDTTSTEESAD